MNWLVKEEPDNYSYTQFLADRTTVWAGVKNPVALMKGIAVYTEVPRRHVTIPLADAYKSLTGPVTVEYIETFDDGTHLLAQTQVGLAVPRPLAA